MESKVKSRILNKTYVSLLEKIEDEDQNAQSELYKLPVSGYFILIAPGKTIMSEEGVAYCYAYVIQNEKVVCKLGVYEKKTNTMPLYFDLSTFPEDAFLLFEEYEMNPSRLLDFEMKEIEPTNTIFDYLIRDLYPKIQDKKKKISETYGVLYGLYKADASKPNMDAMKSILKMISAAKKKEPSDEFLLTMKDFAKDQTLTGLVLVALQPFFRIQFELTSDTEDVQMNLENMRRSWTDDSLTYDLQLEVNVETKEWKEPSKKLSIIPEETSVSMKSEYKEPDDAEYKVPEEIEITEYNPEPEETETPEPVTIKPRPPPKSKRRSQKSLLEPPSQAEESAPRGTSLNTVLPSKPLGTSMNSVLPPSETKPRTKTKEGETAPKLKMTRIPKVKPSKGETLG